MFSEKRRQLGVRLGCVALALVSGSLGACGEQVVVGTQPAEAPLDLPSTDADGGSAPPRGLAASEPDSDGDDDDDDDDDDDEQVGEEPSDPDDDGSADDELDGDAAD